MLAEIFKFKNYCGPLVLIGILAACLQISWSGIITTTSKCLVHDAF